MDKSLKLAVAGAGKTTYIVNDLKENDKAIVLTYTNANHQNLVDKVTSKFGKIPQNIHILTFFNFLYQFCYSPFLKEEIGAKGISWDLPHWRTRFKKRSDLKFYLDKSNRLYYNRISKLILEKVDIEALKNRLEKYYSKLYIDEVQDLGGHDFNLTLELLKADIYVRLVGDFYQHTYSTSQDLKTNSNIHQSLENFVAQFEPLQITVDSKDLNKSWRCSAEVCQFIRENFGIEIYPRTEKSSEVSFITDKIIAEQIFNDGNTVKLFYEKSDSYKCYSNNWGKSKGVDEYEDVCVVLNKKSTRLYKKNNLSELPSTSKNKLYVACSRPHKNLFLVPISLVEDF